MSPVTTTAGGQETTTTPAHRRPALIEAGITLGLVAAFLAIQTLYLLPPRLYDPADYFSAASRFPDVFVHHRTLRFGLTLPVRGAIEIFGQSEAAFYAVPYLAGLGLMLATYALGRVMVSRTVGIAAAVLVVLNPYTLAWSSQIHPDIPSAALFTAALVLIVHVARRYPDAGAPSASATVLLVGAGILLGGAYLVREFAAAFFVAVPVVAALSRLGWRRLLVVAGAALAVFALEVLWNWWLLDDPLIRLRETFRKPVPGAPQDAMNAARAEGQGSTLARLAMLPRLLLANSTGIVFVGLLGSLAAAAAVKRSRTLLILGAWTAVPAGILTLTGLIEDQHGKSILFNGMMRYWYAVLPPLLVGGLAGGAALAGRIRPWRGIRLGGVLVVVVATAGVLLAVGDLSRHRGFYRAGATEYHDLRSWLATNGEAWDVLWTTDRMSRVAGMYTRSTFGRPLWHGAVGKVNTARRFRDARPDRGLFLLEDDFLAAQFSNWRGFEPRWLLAPPATWELVWMPPNGELALFAIAPHRGTSAGGSSTVESRSWEVTSGGPAGWQGRSLSTAAGPVRLDLEPGRSMVMLSDGQQDGIGSAAPPDGGYVRATVELGASGRGLVQFQCVFESPGSVARSRAVTAWGTPQEWGTAGIACPVPDGRAAGTEVRIAMRLTGPVRLDLGKVEIAMVAGTG